MICCDLLDIVVSSRDPCEPLRLYLNSGDGTFADVSQSAGLLDQLGGLNITQTDYDGDGRNDMPGLISPILHYQVGNEYYNELFWAGTADEYCRLLEDFCGAARQACPEVKVILSSGYGYEGIMQKMQKDGLAGFQQKPYSLEDLGQTIRKLFS